MVYPPITSYHYHSDLLSVLLTHEESKTWLFNNYIQLEIPSRNANSYDMDTRMDFSFPYSVWKSCPFLYYQRICRDFIKSKWNSVTEFIRDSINLDYYIYFDIDRYYIPGTNSYHDYHHTHDLFVYGYDDEKQIFYITDYNISGKYSYNTADYDEVEDAYQEQPKVKDFLEGEGVELIYFYPRKHELNIPFISQSIKDYLESTNTFKRYIPDDLWRGRKDNLVYGCTIHEYLRFFIQQYLPVHDVTEYRLFNVFCEHKRLMCMRIQYLGEQGYLQDSGYIYSHFKVVEHKAYIAQNLLLKYYITRENQILLQILNHIDWVEENEVKVLKYMLDNLESDPVPSLLRQASDIYRDQHIRYISLKIGEQVELPVYAPLDNAKTLIWSSDSNSVTLIREGKENVTARCLFSGNTVLTGRDNEGDLRAVYFIKCLEKGFCTNMSSYKFISGKWIEDYDGIIGSSVDDGIIISEESIINFTLEADVTIQDGEAAMIIVKASDKLNEFSCVVLDSNGLLKLWFASEDVSKVPIIIEKGVPYHLTIIVDGSMIKVLLDGIIRIKYDKMNSIQAPIGLRVFKGICRFQNVYYQLKESGK